MRTITLSDEEFLDFWYLIESIMAGGQISLEIENILRASRIALAVNRSNRNWIPYELGAEIAPEARPHRHMTYTIVLSEGELLLLTSILGRVTGLAAARGDDSEIAAAVHLVNAVNENNRRWIHYEVAGFPEALEALVRIEKNIATAGGIDKQWREHKT
jgi:hypothetical protein